MPMLILCPFYIQVDDYSSRVFKAELSSAVFEEEWGGSRYENHYG